MKQNWKPKFTLQSQIYLLSLINYYSPTLSLSILTHNSSTLLLPHSLSPASAKLTYSSPASYLTLTLTYRCHPHPCSSNSLTLHHPLSPNRERQSDTHKTGLFSVVSRRNFTQNVLPFRHILSIPYEIACSFKEIF